MDDWVTSLLVGVVGGFIGAMGGVAVQHLENRAGARERREQRLADAASEFVMAATAWSEWIGTGYTNRRLSDDKVLDTNNERSRARQAAYRKLQLHCSKKTFQWLKRVYEPVEYDVNEFAGGPLIKQLNDIIDAAEEAEAKGAPTPPRRPPVLDARGKGALRDYKNLVEGPLIDRCRAEVDALSRTERYLERKVPKAS